MVSHNPDIQSLNALHFSESQSVMSPQFFTTRTIPEIAAITALAIPIIGNNFSPNITKPAIIGASITAIADNPANTSIKFLTGSGNSLNHSIKSATISRTGVNISAMSSPIGANASDTFRIAASIFCADVVVLSCNSFAFPFTSVYASPTDVRDSITFVPPSSAIVPNAIADLFSLSC